LLNEFTEFNIMKFKYIMQLIRFTRSGIHGFITTIKLSDITRKTSKSEI